MALMASCNTCRMASTAVQILSMRMSMASSSRGFAISSLVRETRTLHPAFLTLKEKQKCQGATIAQQCRQFSAGEPINMETIKQRVLLVLNLYDKIDNNKLTLETHFMKDLGLDSLDHVEVIMAIEDEFGFEIPDDHAEKLMTPAKIVQYVADHEDVHH